MSTQKRYLLTTLIPLLVLVVGTMLWATLSVSSVPQPMAIHFDANSVADGFLDPVTNMVLVTAISLLLLVIFVVLARSGMWHGTTGRIVAGSTGFSVALLSALQIELFRIQRGLSDASEATMPGLSLGLSLLIAIIIGGLVAFLVQPVPNTEPPSTPPAHPNIPDQGKAVWLRSESMHVGVQIVLVLAVVTAFICLIIVPSWATVLTAVLAVVVALSTWGWRYRIDNQGLSYRSYLGFPRGKIPHHAIASAESVHVQAANWGGWGWRFKGSGTGLITHTGPGLRITRTNGRVLEITSDDAPTAAGLLKYYTAQTTTKDGF